MCLSSASLNSSSKNTYTDTGRDRHTKRAVTDNPKATITKTPANRNSVPQDYQLRLLWPQVQRNVRVTNTLGYKYKTTNTNPPCHVSTAVCSSKMNLCHLFWVPSKIQFSNYREECDIQTNKIKGTHRKNARETAHNTMAGRGGWRKTSKGWWILEHSYDLWQHLTLCPQFRCSKMLNEYQYVNNLGQTQAQTEQRSPFSQYHPSLSNSSSAAPHRAPCLENTSVGTVAVCAQLQLCGTAVGTKWLPHRGGLITHAGR